MRSDLRAGALAAAMLVLASCSSGASPVAAPVTTPSLTPVAVKPVTCPLTGLPPKKGVDVHRPAVAVKIENSQEARPQSGLDHADVVFEELVEGGITRFAAIFQCNGVKKAGPVRSARFDDPDFIKPITRGLAFAGANAIVTRSLTRHHLKLFTDFNDAQALYRVPPGNTSEHSLFANVKLLLRQAKKKHLRPPRMDLFHFGAAATHMKKVKKVLLKFEDSRVAEPIVWRWKHGIWKRYESGQPFMSSDGHQVAASNVLIQKVNVKLSSKLVDVVGNPSPRITFSGHGKALLFRNGRVVRGRWKRAPRRFLYMNRRGRPFAFSAGPTWVELLPSNKGPIRGMLRF